MSQKITKEQRIRAHVVLTKNALIIPDMDTALAYLKDLEAIAEASVKFWQKHSTNNDLIPFDCLPPAEQKLMKALDKVDWMRNE